VTAHGDDVLGSFGLIAVKDDRAEVGCWVAPWARRLGVGEAAARAQVSPAADVEFATPEEAARLVLDTLGR
jgi:hypothetical protein